MSSNSSKKIGGRPISKIWEWIIKGDPVPNSKRYYSATCSFCEFHWTTAKVAKLKRHLAYDCNKIDSETKINVLMMLTSNEDSEDDSTTTSTTKSSKKQKSSDTRSQTCIDDHYENFPTPLVKEDQINKALAKMFPLSPNRNPYYSGKYLWCSKNYSDVSHHTGAFLGNEIIKIVDDIDPEKVAAVVSDNAPDARVARRILCEKYPHILNIRCMAHCINLIPKDVCKHTFVADAIKILQIKGGGLKSHTKTHWSTIHRIQAKGPIYRSKVACCTGKWTLTSDIYSLSGPRTIYIKSDIIMRSRVLNY
ncbi:unnamed protein product [Rhizophagus irregularis]|nr:unnamed protein product [Rhizophagus irregularis]